MAVTGELARYQYISTIGSGGMARVDLAEDTLLGRRVALKRMSGPADPRGMSRLRREALAGASLSHANLVSIYDVVSSDDGDLVIVMEYIGGGTLRDALNRRHRLPPDEALRALDGLAAGLDAIHERGIVHRDVKPSNILLGEDGTVKVADLGIAAIPERTRITTAGSVLGSLSYMAPEQLEDSPSTPAIDIYALAAVAYEMLSGEKARGETNPMTLAHAISTQSPPNLRNAWPEAPAAAADVLIRAMARDPADRPRSAGELARRLRAALAPEARAPAPPPAAAAAVAAAAGRQTRRHAVPSAAAPVGTARRGADRPPPREVGSRRSPKGALAVALLALLAAVVVLAVLLNSGGSGSRPPARATTGHAHRTAAAGHTRHSATASQSADPTTAASSGSAGASTPASVSSTAASAASSTQATSSTQAPPAGAAPAPQSAAGPAGAVEAFYGAAAAHRYASAWALADPALRSQLEGYQNFQTGQAGDRSITFNSAKVISQSSHAATVAVQTTSVRDNGTQHCSGTVDLVPGAGGGQWQLHQIHINCA